MGYLTIIASRPATTTQVQEDCLLLEDGTNLLLETGENILL